MAQSPEVEILIHIAAPSRVADDSRYRSLAAAYLDFEPATRVSVSSTSLISDSASRDSPPKPQTSQQEPLQDNSEDDTRLSLSGHVRLLESPFASFRSVLDNANSPRPVTRSMSQLARGNQAIVQSQVTQSTWQSPPSMVEDSIPQNHATATTFTSPTRVLEYYLQAFDSSPQPHARSSGGGSEQVIAGTPVQRYQSNHGSKELNKQQQPSSTPIVPRTPFPETPAAQEGKRTGHRFAQNNKHDTNHQAPDTRSASAETSSDDEEAIEETRLLSSPLEVPSVDRADSEPLPSRKAQKMAADSTSPRQLGRASSDVGPGTSAVTKEKKKKRKTAAAAVVTVNFLASHGLTYEDLALYPPEPPVSASPVEPRGLVTPNLDQLARSLEARKPFRPRAQARALRPAERGYWLLDSAAWGARLRRDCWAFLANYVGTGAAGWGVSCRRDADFRWVRTYCWGAVVPHIYLLLYLATQREILFGGASWVDGDGETVIVMDTRERR